MGNTYYAIGHDTNKCFKGILTHPLSMTIDDLLTHLLNTGIVVSLVTKEKYDVFSPEDVKTVDLAGWIKEGEVSL